MNKTIVIINLIISSISIARSSDETTTDNNLSYSINTTTPYAKEIEANIDLDKTDILKESEINRSLDPTQDQNDRYLKRPMGKKAVSRAAPKIEDKTAFTTTTQAIQSRDGSATKKSVIETTSSFKSAEDTVTTEAFNKNARVESTTISSDSEDKAGIPGNVVISDSVDEDLHDEFDDSNRESDNPYNTVPPVTTTWDAFDDIPDISTRRMISNSGDVLIDTKVREDDNIVEEASSSKEAITKATALFGIQPYNNQPSVVRHIHPILTKPRLLYNPAVLSQRSAMPSNYQDAGSQERVNYGKIAPHRRSNLQENAKPLNQEPDSEAIDPPSSTEYKRIEEFSSERSGNAYPYTPPSLYIPPRPEFMQKSPVTVEPPATDFNPIFRKLVEASQHPRKATAENLQGPYFNFPNYYGLPSTISYNPYRFFSRYKRTPSCKCHV